MRFMWSHVGVIEEKMEATLLGSFELYRVL